MYEQLSLRALTWILFSLSFIALGIAAWFKKKPIIIPKLFILIFILFLVPAYLTHVSRVLDLSHIGMTLAIFIMISPLLLLIAISGDFIFFNVSEELLNKSIVDVLHKHNISFAEAATKGFWAPGGKTKNRKIVTLNFTESRSSLRYLLSTQVMSGHVKFINKKNILKHDEMLEDLKNSLRSKEVDSASSPAYLIVLGLFIIVLHVVL